MEEEADVGGVGLGFGGVRGSWQLRWIGFGLVFGFGLCGLILWGVLYFIF